MKFRCERDVLADAVGSAGRAATNRTGTLPVLAGREASRWPATRSTVTGTDLELTIRLTVEVGGERDGAAVVPARLVGDIVKALPAGAVQIELTDDELSISAGRSQFSVRPLALDDYPTLAEPTAEASRCRPARWPTRSARSCAPHRPTTPEPCSPACSSPPRTTGCAWWPPTPTGSRFVTCPSRRCSARGQKVIIPGRALGELSRVMGDVEELTVRLGEREATFESGTTRLSTRLIEGEFPNYRNLLPSSYPNLLTFGKAAMLEAIRRVKILAQDSTPVRLTLGGDTVQLTAITQDVGNATEEIDATYEGTEMTVAFNPDYLSAGIDAIDSDDVTLATMDPMKPAVLRGVGHDDYLYLLMPVRVP